MKELTRAEEQVMQILWKRGECFVGDLLDDFPDPKPAYNTVSTITRILVKKGFVGFQSFGKSHKYHPLISKEDYTRTYFRRFVKNYFGDSYRDMVSFFTREENLSLDELEGIRKIMKKQIRKHKGRQP
jgi:BlaI family transcriptional regulator, penicillinase repressor